MIEVGVLEIGMAAGASIAAGVLVAFIGFAVALYERFSVPGRRLVLMTTVLGTGMTLFGLTNAVPDAEGALRLFRAGLTVDALLPPALYGLAVGLVRARRRIPLSIAWIAGLSLAVWTATMPTVTTGILSIYEHNYITHSGWAGLLFVVFMAALILATIGELVLAYRNAQNSEDRRRAVTLAVAFGVGALGMIDFFTGTEIFGRAGVSPAAVTATVLILGYAAVRFRAFAPLPSFATERVLHAMADGVVLCDTHGRIRNVNRGAVELFGMPGSALTGKLLAELIETEEQTPGRSGMASAGRSRDQLVLGDPGLTVRDLEARLLRPDGEEIEVSVSSVPARSRAEMVGSVVVIRDIRERVRAARKLHVTEQRYRSLFWDNPALAYEVETDGTVTAINAAAERILGWSAEETAGRPFSDLIHPEDMERANEAFAVVMSGRSEEYEIRVVNRDGETVTLRGISVPVMRDGEVVGVFGVGLDTTAERRVRRELEVQKMEFEELFQGSPEGMLVTDERNRVIRVNPEFTRLFGYTEEDVLGHKMDDIHVPEDRREEAEELNRIARRGDTVRTETVRRRKDGELIHVSVLARQLELPGRPPQLYGIYRDITDRVETEHTLREREVELRHAQRLESIGKLAGGVAHDFNNLVTVINGHARFALDELSDDHPVQRDLAEIERAGTRAADLTQQLLAFSRRQVLKPETVDATAVIDDINQMLDRLIGEHITFETSYDSDAKVRVDRGQLEQVLVNLVVNGRDAMPDGGTMRISTGSVVIDRDDLDLRGWSVDPGEFLRITVRDTGVGMDDETLARAFDPFFTTKEQGKGTGLGLSTVFGIVTQSGGHVTADSAPGEGTTVHVWLPAANAPQGPTAKASEPVPSQRDRTPGLENATILVVEDEDGVRDLVARVLRRAGHEVITAADGKEGLSLAAQHEIDLVLSDLIMPQMGGREMAHRLRADRPDLPVLFMSGYDDEVTTGNRKERLISKPFTPAEIAEAVERTLAERAAHTG